MELVISIAIAVALAEAYVWLPKVAEWLVEYAVSQLQSEDQARCREEWKAAIDRLPNSGVKVLHAFSFSFAARSINNDSMRAKLEQIGDELDVLSEEHACRMKQMRKIEIKLAENYTMRRTLADAVDRSVSSLRAYKAPQVPKTANEDIARRAAPIISAYEKLVDAAEKLDRLVIIAVNRLSDITEARTRTLSTKVEQKEIQIRTFRVAHRDALGLLRKRKLSQLAGVLKKLDNELQMLRVTDVDEPEDVEQVATQQEYVRISAALQGVVARFSPKEK
jgi:hypothetical protein